jgi:hypothetical protein
VLFCFVFVERLVQFSVEWRRNDPSGGVGMWPIASWDCGFESLREHGCLSVGRVLCCQVEVSATGWSLAQRKRIECAVSVWMWSWDPSPLGAVGPWGGGGWKGNLYIFKTLVKRTEIVSWFKIPVVSENYYPQTRCNFLAALSMT